MQIRFECDILYNVYVAIVAKADADVNVKEKLGPDLIEKLDQLYYNIYVYNPEFFNSDEYNKMKELLEFTMLD